MHIDKMLALIFKLGLACSLLMLSAVHMRIRRQDSLRPSTLDPPTSADTYWMIEHEKSTLEGLLPFESFKI